MMEDMGINNCVWMGEKLDPLTHQLIDWLDSIDLILMICLDGWQVEYFSEWRDDKTPKGYSDQLNEISIDSFGCWLWE